jgi:hypothetical protein
MPELMMKNSKIDSRLVYLLRDRRLPYEAFINPREDHPREIIELEIRTQAIITPFSGF